MWVLDSVEIPISPKVNNLHGFDIRWLMTVKIPNAVNLGENTAHKTMIGNRDFLYTFKKGQPLFRWSVPMACPGSCRAYR